jgi:hypothetical protein
MLLKEVWPAMVVPKNQNLLIRFQSTKICFRPTFFFATKSHNTTKRLDTGSVFFLLSPMLTHHQLALVGSSASTPATAAAAHEGRRP